MGRRAPGGAGVPFSARAGQVSVHRRLHVKQRERGYDETTMVESFVVLNAVGGECVEDFAHLRADAGLKQTLGHEISSLEAARQFLKQFHCG